MPIAIVDARISAECQRGLMLHGFSVIKTAPSKRLGEAVCAHPDMLMLVYKNRIITSAAYCDEAPYVFTDIREACPSIEIEFVDEEQRPDYPHDAIFNALICKKRMFCRAQTVAMALKSLAVREGLKLIPVKQGYPACTVLMLNEESAITADRGMSRALRSEGIEVTEISDGDILLPPHKYGFIGGAAGVYGNKVFFLGSLDTHRDCEIIKDACKRAGLMPVSLSGEPLADLGRILFI